MLKAATATKLICQLEVSWGITLILKSLQKQLQRRHRQQGLKIDSFSQRSDSHFIAFSVNRKQCAGVIFGSPGTVCVHYCLAILSSVYTVFSLRFEGPIISVVRWLLTHSIVHTSHE